MSWIALKKPTKGGKIFIRPLFVKIIGFIFNWFDIIFAFSIMISCGTFSCRWIKERTINKESQSLVVTFNLEGSPTDLFSKVETGFDLKHVTFLHDGIRCLSTDDILLKFYGSILIISCVLLKICYYKIKNVKNNPLNPTSVTNKSEIILDICFNMILTICHILSVVAPSNITKEYREFLK